MPFAMPVQPAPNSPARSPRHRYRCLACCLLALPWTSRAAPTSAPEQAFFEPLPIVLSVSRLPQSLADTPGALTVIERETIRATGYRRVPDLLRLVPGFNVAWQRAWWGVVNYHGLSSELSNRVLLLIDGRPVNSEYFNAGIDWVGSALDVDDIDRIEVLRGSNSTAYGTNAYLGVINIRTRPASQARGVYAQVTHGDHGIADQTLRLGGSFDRLDLRLTLNQIEDDGLDRLVDDNRHRFANLRADLRLTDRDELSLDLGEVRGWANEGFASDPDNPLRERQIHNSSQQLRWRHVLSPENEFSLQYFRNNDRYVDEIVPELGINLNRETLKEGVEFQHFLRLSPELRAVWGMEWRRDRAASEAFFSTSEPFRSNTRRLFGNLEWRPLPPLTLNLGAMAERVSITGTSVSPRLFANYEVAPGHVLRGGVSTATRAPTMFELFGLPRFTVVVGNPDLDPERITAYEIGYFGNMPAQRVQADLRIYEEQLESLIATVAVPVQARSIPQVVSSFDNVETARIRGASYQLKWSPLASTHLTLAQAFTYIAQRDPEIAESAPTHSTSLMWTQQLPAGFSFSLMHYSVGAMRWLGFGDYIPSYQRTDLRLAYAFQAAGMRGEVSLVGLNLLDDYYEFRVGSEPETSLFGRRVYGSVRIEF
jgi:iron complex outermembrane receptor protein